jgi:PhzF family phenazine biosynthesis protein
LQNIKTKYFHVDAFTEKPFGGNPAAVCFLSTDLDEATYLNIATEMNLLSELSVVEKIEEGKYKIRWFSQKKEVPLCGHATLATAHIVFNHLGYNGGKIEFQSQVGSLYAEKKPEGIQLDFPENRSHKVEPPEQVLASLGITEWVDVQYSPGNQKLMIHMKNYDTLKKVKPDFKALLKAENPLNWRAVMITSPGFDDYDFVSRHFAPLMGVNEDPVTGSNHTILAPYWGEILGKTRMKAYQASERGGTLCVELKNNRVLITGQAATIMEGIIKI